MLIQILFNIIFNRVSDVNFFSRGKEKKSGSLSHQAIIWLQKTTTHKD